MRRADAALIGPSKNTQTSAPSPERALQGCRDLARVRLAKVGESVEYPTWPVEVTCQEPAGVSTLERVDAGVKVTAQVSADDFVGVGKILPMGLATVSPAASDCQAPP